MPAEREAARLARIASPSAPPIMNEVLTMPEARPESLGLTPLMAASRTGLKAIPAPNPSRIMPWQHINDEVPVDWSAREEQKPSRRQRQAERQRELDAEAHDEFGGEAERERAHDEVGWQEGETHQQRAVAEHGLEVEGGEEEPGEHRGGP